jgi:hypothetical protein
MMSDSAAGQYMHYAIQIVTTTLNEGGVRYCFFCPTCGKRVGKLYLARTQFECRICGNLAPRLARGNLAAAKVQRAIRRSVFRQMYGYPLPRDEE